MSIQIFQYFQETQLSEALKYLSSARLLRFSTKCIKPLSDILQPEKSSFSMISPADDYFKLSISQISPSSPSKFLLKFKVLSLPQFTIVIRDFIPSFVISFDDRFNIFRFYILLSMKLKMCSINPSPRSPIPFPLRLMSSSREFTAPQKKVQTPSPNSQLYSKFIFLRFLLLYTYFRRVGPMDDLMKFLPRSSETKLTPLMRIYSAPQVLIRFSEILSYLSCLFFLRGMDMISAPFIPISLSYSFSTSRALFWSNTAAKHLAPSIPNEFLRIEPYSIPKFNYFKWLFFINSSKISESPTSLIMLLARFKCQILVLPIKFLMACMPYSEMELSARLSQVKLYQVGVTDWFKGYQ